MSIQKLKKIMLPPHGPVMVPSQEDWGRLASIGYDVPSDYVQFISIFGIGGIDDFLWFMGPCVKNRHLDLVRTTENLTDAIKLTVDSSCFSDVNEKSLEVGRFFVFAVSDNADICFYFNNSVYVISPRGRRGARFGSSIVDFMLSIVSGAARVPFFPDDFPGENPQYVTAPCAECLLERDN